MANSRQIKYREQQNRTVHKNKNVHNVKKSRSGLVSKIGEMDFLFLTLVIVIVCVGLVMLLSASAPRALRLKNDSFHFFKRQLLFVVVGFVGMILVSRIDYRIYKQYVGIFMVVCLVLLALVLIPSIGVDHNGSRRWLEIPGTGFEIQPSEFMKPVMAMFMAKLIQEKIYNPEKLSGLIRLFVWVGITAILMLLETHVSGTVVISGIAVFVMIAGGAKLRYFIAGGCAVIPAGIIFLLNDPVRSKRLAVAFDPFKDMTGTGFQTVQSLYAIASGGLFGKGLGQSVQKVSFLPEPYNDFIFAVVCEELGLLGAIFVIGLLCALIIRGIVIAIHAPDSFGTLTVVGIMAHIAIQVLFNILVVTATIPNTGITLPFFSYGGTAILVLLLEMGVVLNVSRHSVKNKE